MNKPIKGSYNELRQRYKENKAKITQLTQNVAILKRETHGIYVKMQEISRKIGKTTDKNGRYE